LLDDVVAASTEPLGDYSLFPTLLVSRLASQQFKVVLSGDGGDELFWGYVKRMGSAIELAHDFRQPRLVRIARWALRRAARTHAGHDHLRRRSVGDWQRSRHNHLGDEWLGEIFPSLPEWPAEETQFSYTRTQQDETAQWIRWNEFVCHLTMVLLKVDRASMHHSLEVRVPLLDKEVIETSLQVDWRSCIDIGQGLGKLPLRQALAREVRHQTTAKRGFEVPMGKWLRGSLRDVFEAHVVDRDEIMGLPVNRPAMRALFDEHLRGDRDKAWGLWPLLSLSLWEAKHLAARATAH
jgi:asparagine synthase (glutamine-hydrolysing)